MADELMDYDEALERFEPVLGFEVHVELNTKTKMFCGCANSFGSGPNTNVCPVCIGLPGSLPTVNHDAVISSIRLGLSLGCQIADTCRFARKNYFYPDLAKAYQISQYDEPIAFEGQVPIELEDGTAYTIPIERAHMEEDAGKLTHVGATGRISDARYSLVDYNRAGVPLVEIVTKPIYGTEERAPEVGRAYVAAIRDIVKALGVSDARMDQGSIRCDANISIRPRGQKELGTRTETKNINSLRSVERAVRYEIRRQAAVLAAGGAVVQQTRHWHEDTGVTSAGRIKSDADDYRYFPEPDLVPIVTPADEVERLRATLPELPHEKKPRLKAEWGFTDLEFRDVVNGGLLDVVDATVRAGASPAAARKWWTGELTRLANSSGVETVDLGITPDQVAELDSLVTGGTITDRIARDVIQHVLDGEGSPAEIVETRGLGVVSDDSALLTAIDEALAHQPDVLEKIRNGKVQAAGAIIGMVMKSMHGKADAARVRELVIEKAQG